MATTLDRTIKVFTRRIASILFRVAVPCILAGAATTGVAADKPVFIDQFNGKPIEVPLKAGEVETPAVKQFKESGNNIYRNDPVSVQGGKALYQQWCQSCHNSDATGKIGPALIGSQRIYPQTATDVGMFSIIYAGAAGAMQPFSKRDLSQDEMLKIIAYIRSLDRK